MHNHSHRLIAIRKSGLDKVLLKNKFTHFTADNIDFNDSTLDGKNAFHATAAAWQRGPSTDVQLNYLFPSKKILW